jgi:membrane protein YqaA with SNARE-associated domain
MPRLRSPAQVANTLQPAVEPVIGCGAARTSGAMQSGWQPEAEKVVDIKKGVLSFGSMTLLVGGLALVGLLLWGWKTGQELPLWPALLVAAVNVFGAFRLVMETRARQAARQAAAKAAQPHRKGKG